VTAGELFVEGRGTWTLRVSDRGMVGWKAEHDCGLGWTVRSGDGVTYHWEAIEAGRPGLPSDSIAAAEWACDRAAARAPDGRWTEALVALCRGARTGAGQGAVAALSGERRRKHVAAEAAVSDERAHVHLVMWIAGPSRTVTLARVYPGPADFLADRAGLERAIAAAVENLGRVRVTCPDGVLPVVLGAGAPAHFFHEVYGHPMEGDVVARGESYLAARRGRAIAGELLTLVDDPRHPGAPAGQVVDDEGRQTRPVTLIDRGRVGEPLLDQESARRLGLAPNGHARRMSFRFCTLPRLTHVRVAGHDGTEAGLVGSIEHGVLVRWLRLRHLNALTGAFSFYLDDAREIRSGEVGAPLTPGLLLGDGLSAAAAVDGVASGDGGEPCGVSGCGKLDQGPLIVSFQQPAVRFSAARVRPWR
jgi:TldD protein